LAPRARFELATLRLTVAAFVFPTERDDLLSCCIIAPVAAIFELILYYLVRWFSTERGHKNGYTFVGRWHAPFLESSKDADEGQISFLAPLAFKTAVGEPRKRICRRKPA
jgi:hypothetical protein